MSNNQPVKRIAIVGTGVIGASWAAQYLARGFHVVGTDPAPNAEANLRKYVDEAWDALTKIGLSPGASGRIAIPGLIVSGLFMLAIPLFLRRFGMKTTLLVGMFAWAARYLLFAFGDAGPLAFMLIIGIALHGAAQLVFVDTLWPDFSKEHLEQAIAEFRRRDRRYGGIGS